MGGTGTGVPVTGTPSGGGLVTPPAFEPVSLSELKLHLRLDSNSFAESVDETRSILAGDHAFGVGYALLGTPVEVLGYTALVELAAGTFPATGTAEVKIQESDTDGSVLTLTIANSACVEADGTKALVFTGTCVTAATGTYTILSNVITAVSITTGGLGYTTAPTVTGPIAPGSITATIGTWTDWTGGAFTMVTAANDEATYEKAYTGTKRYIRTVAQVLLDTCDFGTSVIRLAATSVEDTLLTELITTARLDVENDSRRAIITQTWDYCLKQWPCGDRIKIPLGNLQNIVSVKWKDTAGVETPLITGTDYLTETNGDQCGFVVLPYGISWPNGDLYPSKPITIRYVAGWPTAALVPSTVKSAIKIRCSKLYESRGEDILGQTVHEDKTYDRLVNNIPRLYDEFI